MSVRDKDLERLVLDRTPGAEPCEDELDYAVVDRVYDIAPSGRRHGAPLAANAAEHED